MIGDCPSQAPRHQLQAASTSADRSRRKPATVPRNAPKERPLQRQGALGAIQAALLRHAARRLDGAAIRAHFATRGIPIVAGRDFGPDDAVPRKTIIISRTFAQRSLPNQDPIGKRVVFRHRQGLAAARGRRRRRRREAGRARPGRRAALLSAVRRRRGPSRRAVHAISGCRINTFGHQSLCLRLQVCHGSCSLPDSAGDHGAALVQINTPANGVTVDFDWTGTAANALENLAVASDECGSIAVAAGTDVALARGLWRPDDVAL